MPLNPVSPLNKPPLPGRRWYRQWWGIFAILFASLFLLVSIVFLAGLIASSGQPTDDNPLAEYSTDNLTSIGLIGKTTQGPATVVTSDDPAFGNAEAALTIVAFEDFQCPFCGEMFPVIREMLAKYETKLRFIYRDFPNVDIHPEALVAAEAGECADEQGKFWPFHDRLYQNQDQLGRTALVRYAEASGLDKVAFTACLDSGKYQDEVVDDLQAGFDAGATGTPTFFFNGYRVTGSLPADVFETIIQQFIGTR